MRNAFSGSSRLSTPAAGATPWASKSISRENNLAKRGVRFRGDPIQIRGQAALDCDRDDLGKFIGVAVPDRCFKGRIALKRGLDEHRVLFIVLQRALPSVNGATGRKDVDACGELRLDQVLGEPLRGRAIRQVSQY